MKDTAVMILNWNGAEMMRRFLPEVVRTTPESEADIIVVDNGSSDNSLKVLADEFPTVKVMAFDTNYGFAEGYNRALAAVGHEYVVLLNSDVATTDGWLDGLKDEMRRNSDVAACQPKIMSVEKPEMFEYAGACGGYIDRHGYPYCRGRIFGTVEADRGQYDTPADVAWASGAALMVRRRCYLDAGGLDGAFFAHMEEIDLCWRLRLAGYRLRAVPTSKVYHLGGGSLPAGNPRKTYLNFRNNLLMLYKNLPHKGRRRALIVRRLLDTIAWGKSVATMKWGDAGAILRAHRDFRRMKHAYDTLPSPTENLICDAPDILTSYYLKGKKEFSRLMKQ
ncbi:MAG: glycosyltransferase family 2 protein [Muribaculaceae bacterium]|nr:glycosyltransferase family 2 protein [Muribaculaceae bacterium]MDE6346556.1 glycosyltransferase family 2 protein [Muribaculaceae bacterium]